jgi:hypothetical protein
MATTYELISSVTVGSGGAQSMAFTSIPQTYTDLLLKVSSRNTADNYGGFTLYRTAIGTRFQGKFLSGEGTSGTTSGFTSEFFFTRSGNTASVFSNVEFYIPNYTLTSLNKTLGADGIVENNTTSSYRFNAFYAYDIADSAAINQLYIEVGAGFADKFAQYSTAYLYGISNA